MKKFLTAILICLLFSGTKILAETVFDCKTDAKTASQKVPQFETASCKFTQEKYLKTSAASLHSNGNFKFLKDKGVIFETVYPIQSTAAYTKGQNKIVNSIIRAISSKNYTYLEKNFDIYFKESNKYWILALKPKTSSEMSAEILNIQIYGTAANNKGSISKIIIDSKGTKTTLSFTNCG